MPVRGWCFAPIRFRTPLYLNVGFRYRPWCAVPTDNLFVHLWSRPRSSCYYFGNYYGQGGFIPWYRCGWGDNRRYYDPLGSWCRTHYRRQGIDYTARMDQWHDHFVRNENLRPPRTWRDQRDLVARTDIDVRDSQRILGADLRDLARRDDLPVKLTKLDQRQRDALAQVNTQLQEFRTQRVKIETEGKARVAGRIPLDGDAIRPGDLARPNRTPGARAGADATARVREDIKLRLPKLDSQTAARIDAALGAGAGVTAGAPSRSRTLPAAADPGPRGKRGPAGDRTGRTNLPDLPDHSASDRADPDRSSSSSRADDVLRDLRNRGVIPDIQPRTTPRVDVPDRTPRIDVPRTETPRTTPKVDVPRTTPRLEVPRTESTPRSAPKIDIPQVKPKSDVPRNTPRIEVPRTTPRVDIPRVTPRVDIPRTSPRIEVPNGNSGASRSSASPSRSSASAAARNAIESARNSAAAARGSAGRASRGRDQD